MPRKKNHHPDQMQHETQMTKLKAERIKLKTMEYTLKLTAQSKQRVVDEKHNNNITVIQKTTNDMLLNMIEDLQNKLHHANAEIIALRGSH